MSQLMNNYFRQKGEAALVNAPSPFSVLLDLAEKTAQ